MTEKKIIYQSGGRANGRTAAYISSLLTTIESQNSQIESLKAITELKNAEIERLVKFLTDLRNMTPYAMYIEMIDGVLCAK